MIPPPVHRKPRLAIALLCLMVVAAVPASAGDDQPAPPTNLGSFVCEPRFRQAWWAIHIQSLATGDVFFATNQHKLTQPASAAKLFITALALDHFGSAHRFVTSLHADAPPQDGTLPGDLVVLGQGDFSFGAPAFAADPDQSFDRLIDAILAAGIRRIDGDLVGDATAWADPPWGVDWAWDDLQHGYGAPASSLSFGDSRVALLGVPSQEVGEPCQWHLDPPTDTLQIFNRTLTAEPDTHPALTLYRAPGSRQLWVFGQLPAHGSEVRQAVSVPDPNAYFLEQLRARLTHAGIEIKGQNRAVTWPAAHRAPFSHPGRFELGRVTSPPMDRLLEGMLAASQNQAAQILLAQVGASHLAHLAHPPADPAPFASIAGLARLRLFLERYEIPSAEIHLIEASGLARSDRVSPAALTRLLQVMDTHPEHQAFAAALPSQLIQGLPATMTVRAKTGSLSDVATLAGYLTTNSRERFAFAIMLNAYGAGRSGEARTAVNDLMRILAAEIADDLPEQQKQKSSANSGVNPTTRPTSPY